MGKRKKSIPKRISSIDSVAQSFSVSGNEIRDYSSSPTVINQEPPKKLQKTKSFSSITSSSIIGTKSFNNDFILLFSFQIDGNIDDETFKSIQQKDYSFRLSLYTSNNPQYPNLHIQFF